MESQKLYEVAFGATGDPQLDAETLEIEDNPLTLEAIVQATQRYKVRARLIEDGQVIGEFVPADERPSSVKSSLRISGGGEARPSSG